MSRIVIFGAGGRTGRRVIAEATHRNHQVTAVVRNPTQHPDLGVPVVAGDATNPASVAAIAATHDAVISAIYRQDIAPEAFFTAAAKALLTGATAPEVPRLVAVSLGTVLPGAPTLPPEHQLFTDARKAELDTFQQADTAVDWLLIAPPPTMLDPDGDYRAAAQTLDTPPEAP